MAGGYQGGVIGIFQAYSFPFYGVVIGERYLRGEVFAAEEENDGTGLWLSHVWKHLCLVSLGCPKRIRVKSKSHHVI